MVTASRRFVAGWHKFLTQMPVSLLLYSLATCPVAPPTDCALKFLVYRKYSTWLAKINCLRIYINTHVVTRMPERET